MTFSNSVLREGKKTKKSTKIQKISTTTNKKTSRDGKTSFRNGISCIKVDKAEEPVVNTHKAHHNTTQAHE